MFFEYLSFSSSIILLPFALINWKRLDGRMKLLVWAICASVLSDTILLVLVNLRTNMWPVGNLFLLIHFSLLFLILSDGRKNPIWKVLFYGSIVFGVINYFFLQTPSKFNSYTAYSTGMLIITLSLILLYEMMNDIPLQRIQTLPKLWLSFGVLLYYGGTLFIFLFNNYLSEHLPQMRLSLWIVHNSINILKNVFFFATIWVNYKSKISPL